MAQIGLLEDNARIAHLCATILQYAGHQVIVYKHPRECLQALLPQAVHENDNLPVSSPASPPPLPVEVLILDLNLPDMGGVDVLQSLCAHPQTRLLPLIFCTAATPSEIMRALRIAPQARLVEKPFTFQELISAITHALEARKEQQKKQTIGKEIV